jgi:hypothetical protein
VHQLAEIFIDRIILAGDAAGQVGDAIFEARDHRRVGEEAIAVNGRGRGIGDLVHTILHRFHRLARLALAHLDMIDNVAHGRLERTVAGHILRLLRKAIRGEFIAE